MTFVAKFVFSFWIALAGLAGFLPEARIDGRQAQTANTTEVQISLNSTLVRENSPNGTVVGTFSIAPADAGKPTYTLTDDAGGRFDVIGDKLLVNDGSRLDYEAANEHQITVSMSLVITETVQPLVTEKSFTIEIQDVLGDPTDITLSDNTVYEDHTSGTTIGRFYTTDRDAEDAGQHTYTLLEDANGLFDIVDNKLILAYGRHLEYEADGSNEYAIEVLAMDPTFKSVIKSFTIQVKNVPGGCTYIDMSGDNRVQEHSPNGTVIGQLFANDSDNNAQHTFRLLDSAGGRFVIIDNQLQVLDGSRLDYEKNREHQITVQATNIANGSNLSCSAMFTIYIEDVAGDPTAITLSSASVQENSARGTVVGTLSVTDTDTPTGHQYQLLDSANGRFLLDGNNLLVSVGDLIDYEQAITHTIRIRVIDVDGLTFERDFTIQVQDVVGDPKGLSLSHTTVPEKSASGTVIGSFSTEASEIYSTHTYSLTNTADGRFAVSQDGNLIVADGSRLDCDTAKTHIIRAQTRNEVGLTFEQDFVIELTCAPPAKILGYLVPSTHNVRELDTVLLMATVIPNKQDYAEASPITNVRIRLNKFTEIPLYDDGTHGDFAQKDGMYTTYYQFKGNLGEHSLELVCDDPDNPGSDLLLDTQTIVVKDIEGVELLVLTDWHTLYDEFRDTGMTQDEDENDNGIHDFADLVMRMQRYTESYNGTVVDLPSNIQDYPKFEEHTAIIESGCAGNYADIPYGGVGETGLKNRHCKGLLIDELVWHYTRHGTVKNLVILGDDEVVPFYRVLDATEYYGQVSGNTSHKGSAERDYMQDDELSRGNPVLNDLNLGYVMSDVPYSVSGVQNITRDYNWIDDPNNQRQPAVDIGIGRIFDLHPWSLQRAIDNWEKPVQIKPGTGKASIFIGSDTPVSEGGSGLDMQEIARYSMTKPMGAWFQDNLSLYSPSWTAYTLLRALEDSDVIGMIGNSDHMSLQIRPGSTIQGSELQGLDYPNTALIIGLGSHMGLSVNDHGDDAGTGVEETYDKSWVVNTMGYGHGITLFAPTTFGYVYGKDIVQEPALHERMSLLFGSYLTDETVVDMGNLWKRVYYFYNASYPTEDQGNPDIVGKNNVVGAQHDSPPVGVRTTGNSEPANGSGLFHTTAAYGVAFYGLPTQKIRTSYANLCPVDPTNNGGIGNNGHIRSGVESLASIQQQQAYQRAHVSVTSNTAQSSTVLFDGTNEEIHIGFEDPSNVPSGYAILSWVVHTLSGDVIASERQLINMDDFKASEELTLTHQVDTTGWSVLENMTMDIHLYSCQQQLANGSLGIIPTIPGTTMIATDTLKGGFELRDSQPMQKHRYTEDDQYATWIVAVHNQNGLIQTDLSNNFQVFVAGKEIDEVKITQESSGSYTIQIPLSAVVDGTSIVRIEVFYHMPLSDSTRTLRDTLVDQITYDAGSINIIENPVGTHVYDLTDDEPDEAVFELDIGIAGLTKDDFALNVDGMVCGTDKTCDFEVLETASGHYRVVLKPLTKDMGTNPKVAIEVRDGQRSSIFVKELTLILPTVLNNYRFYLPLIPNTCPVYVPCNSFDIDDIPENETAMQLHTCCTRSNDTKPNDEDDYYVVNLQAGESITATLSCIPSQADYDLVLYDHKLDDYMTFSTQRGNVSEQIAYTATEEGKYYLRIMLQERLASANSYRLCVDE